MRWRPVICSINSIWQRWSRLARTLVQFTQPKCAKCVRRLRQNFSAGKGETDANFPAESSMYSPTLDTHSLYLSTTLFAGQISGSGGRLHSVIHLKRYGRGSENKDWPLVEPLRTTTRGAGGSARDDAEESSGNRIKSDRQGLVWATIRPHRVKRNSWHPCLSASG